MHSRIIQLEKSKQTSETKLTENKLPKWFMNQIADYCISANDLKSTIDCLNYLCKNKCLLNEGTITFPKGTKCEYFKEKYEMFTTYSKTLSEITLEQFAGEKHSEPIGIDMLMYHLDVEYDDKYAYYIFQNHTLFSLDEWIRTEMIEEEKYYIGEVLDYHF